MWVRRGDGQEFARLEGKENDENIHYRNFGWTGYSCVGAIETPPPMLRRPAVEGVAPRAFQPGGNPLQMLNPWAPARYGTWVESTSFDPDHPGKWNGIKLFEIIF